jgi:hypothetical protein
MGELIVYGALYLGGAALAVWFGYIITKAAVRNGVLEARAIERNRQL